MKSRIKAMLCVLGFVLYVGGCFEKQSRLNSSKPVTEVPGDKILSVEEMTEDLEYTIDVLGDVHPQTYKDFSDKQKQLIESLRSRMTKPMEAREFYFIINKLFFSFKDGHTIIYPMKRKSNKFIDTDLVWLHDGLYVTSEGDNLKQGDKVIAVGDRSVDNLLEELTHIIPAENLHSVKYEAGKSLTRQEHLDYLGVIQDDSVDYHVQRGNSEFAVNMKLTGESKNKSKKTSRPWVSFQIDKELSIGIFTLDKCIYNDEYEEALEDFFAEVSENNIQHVAVDVRQNSGGNSQVINEFLTYVDIKKYKSFNREIRYSKATAQHRNTPKDKGYEKPLQQFNTKNNQKCPDPNMIFKGKLYVLVSAATFSSANWFAVIVKDNKLGTVIGEPTGNKPTSYGDVLNFQIPNTGFRFICSHKKWIRPDTNNDPEDGLYPNVTAYTTIEDIIRNKDTQIEKLKEICKRK
jgi:C-terminal processing protease CtpA/Prc